MFIRDVIRDREPYSLRASASVLEAAGVPCAIISMHKAISDNVIREWLNAD